MPLADQPSPRSRTATALAAELAEDAQVAPDVATFTTVELDVPVHGGYASGVQLHNLSAAHGLLRAPFVEQALLNHVPVLVTELRRLARAPSPGHGVLVRLLVAVVAVVRGRVATSLSAESR